MSLFQSPKSEVEVFQKNLDDMGNSRVGSVSRT